MSYIALYREWRPQSFADMVGQEHVTRTLQNALRKGRIAHAYLFSGPRGTGKTSSAKILAKAINCVNGPAEEPCNECPACRGITAGSIMDVVEIDAASNRGVDEIRELREQVKYAPTEVRYKVYIVDEVHMLTTEAFNALLKTLEEPPQHVVFILATTEPHKLPATILSRCQRFDFHRISGRQTVDRLRQIAADKQISVAEDALWMIARAAEGGMRDALSIFDQLISFGGDQVTADTITSLLGGVRTDVLSAIASAIAEKDMQQALTLLGSLLEEGKEAGQILHELTVYFRDLLMLKTVPGLQEVQDRAQYDKQFAEIAERFEAKQLIDMITRMTDTAQEMKWHNQGTLLLEMLMIRLCKDESDDKQELIRRIENLERQLAAGVIGKQSTQETFGTSGEKAQQSSLDRSTATPRQAAGTRSSQPAGTQKQTAKSPVSQPESSQPAPSPAARSLHKLIQNPNYDLFQKVSSGWNQVLDEVKRRKITAQAWLLDGEPTAVDSGNVIVAFKNQIHRDTVMKPIHKSVIDEVLSEFLGEPCSLVAVLQSEWKAFKQQGHEELASTAEDPLVSETITLFGQDLVEIED
ncbi:DNA polymerase III subunit gamma/tau [Effusibacillus dendaii]|uniref:DNA-directed DNA polymerase n=1 Tax=Effusibacillus dendaii TaxID=2743772 RepID=A0A7I8DBT3_9BACL|nr:DNA polymerase III subunit gamma/tau [Effusibacillus dendaii]BCJ87447.1 DNA polymerase III subunit gamma/tau [Effusibacillus dendaii]